MTLWNILLRYLIRSISNMSLNKIDGIYLGASGVYCIGGPIIISATQLNESSQSLIRLENLIKKPNINIVRYWKLIAQLLETDLIKTQCTKVITVEEQRNANVSKLIKMGLLDAAIQLQLRTGLNKIYAPPQFLLSSTTTRFNIVPSDSLYSRVPTWLAKRTRLGLIRQLAAKFPQYQLEHNLGRSISSHQLSILRYGPNPGVHPSPESFNIGLWIYSLLRQDYREVLAYTSYLTQPPEWWRKHHLNKIPADWLNINQREELPLLLEQVRNRDILARRKRTSFQTYLSSIQLPSDFQTWLQQHPPTDSTLQ